MTIEIIQSRCTNCIGCELCIEFCPQNILILNQGKIQVTNPEKRTCCKVCELCCHSLAIFIN